jgi:hypothetical protein
MAYLKGKTVPGENLAEGRTKTFVTVRHQNTVGAGRRRSYCNLHLENLKAATAAQGDPFTPEALTVETKTGRASRTAGNHQNLVSIKIGDNGNGNNFSLG